jgi:hypothetical protein
MNASNAAYAPSDLLSVRFLKSLALSFLVPTQWQPWAIFRLRGLVVYTIPSTILERFSCVQLSWRVKCSLSMAKLVRWSLAL